jgi:hypothetical protein
MVLAMQSPLSEEDRDMRIRRPSTGGLGTVANSPWNAGLSLAACFLVACAGESPRGKVAFHGTVRDSAGIRIVNNTREGVWGAAAATVAEVLTIGEAAGDPNYQFGQIAGIDVMSDGRIAVLDRQARRVQIYEPDGTYDRSLGRPGSGPGEFSARTMTLFVGRGDTIVVPDVGNQRIHLIPPEGEFAAFPLRTEQGVPMRFELAEDGALVSQRRPMSAPDPGSRTSAVDLVLKQAYDGTITDTLLMPPRAESFELGETGPRFKLFAPEPRWTLLGSGRLATATTDAYRVGIYGPDGRLEQVLTLPFEARPVDASDRRTALALLRLSMKNRGASPEAVERMSSAVSFADTLPVLADLLGGPDGTLWVQRPRNLSEVAEDDLDAGDLEVEQGGREWDVFEADGRYGGMVEFPDGFTPLRFRGDRVYGVYRDQFDVQFVRAYRLVTPRPGDA